MPSDAAPIPVSRAIDLVVERARLQPDEIVVLRFPDFAGDDGLRVARSLADDARAQVKNPIIVVFGDATVSGQSPDVSQATRIIAALRAWQAAWQIQGDDRMHAMVNAARLTDEALKGIP